MKLIFFALCKSRLNCRRLRSVKAALTLEDPALTRMIENVYPVGTWEVNQKIQGVNERVLIAQIQSIWAFDYKNMDRFISISCWSNIMPSRYTGMNEWTSLKVVNQSCCIHHIICPHSRVTTELMMNAHFHCSLS